MQKLVALLTDFGLEDSYVAVMKAVMRTIEPELDFVDISHAVHPQSVRSGAITLMNSHSYFPDGTIFLVVIDPGVGSHRRPVVVKAGPYYFVAPDNGVLSYALAQFEDYQAVTLSNRDYHLPQISHTFHGRDIFAPAAAHLAHGVAMTDFGTTIDDLVSLPEPQLHIEAGRITGEVLHIDHFGNVATSIGKLRWVGPERLVLTDGGKSVRIPARNTSLRLHGETISSIAHAFHELPRGHLLAQVDSNGYLEVAVNQGSAAQRLGVAVGDEVSLIYKMDTGLLAES